MGDSGAPLIVQPKGMRGRCCLIGIHSSGRYKSGVKDQNSNKAVRLTESAVRQLAIFEKEMNMGLSLIPKVTINFGKKKELTFVHR